MTYKDIAVKNEQRLKQENQRLKDLLRNAICFMEETQSYYGTDDEVFEYVLDYLGMEVKEYKEIME